MQLFVIIFLWSCYEQDDGGKKMTMNSYVVRHCLIMGCRWKKMTMNNIAARHCSTWNNNNEQHSYSSSFSYGYARMTTSNCVVCHHLFYCFFSQLWTKTMNVVRCLLQVLRQVQVTTTLLIVVLVIFQEKKWWRATAPLIVIQFYFFFYNCERRWMQLIVLFKFWSRRKQQW